LFTRLENLDDDNVIYLSFVTNLKNSQKKNVELLGKRKRKETDRHTHTCRVTTTIAKQNKLHGH
jgi:hypothetical protein